MRGQEVTVHARACEIANLTPENVPTTKLTKAERRARNRLILADRAETGATWDELGKQYGITGESARRGGRRRQGSRPRPESRCSIPAA
jgi:hypothetical protein